MSTEVQTEGRQERMKSRRSKRKHARLARLRRQILRYTVLCALLYLGFAGFVKVPWAPASVDEDVTVYGNQIASERQVKDVLKQFMEKPVYKLDPRTMSDELKKLPPVHTAVVRRYLLPRPHIVVHVMEEFPWASYSPAPELPCEAVITQTGRLVPVSQFPGVPQPPLKIYGQPGFKLAQSDVNLWGNWIQYISVQTGREVSSLDLRRASDIRVQAGELSLALGSADTTLSKRLSRLASVVPAVEGLKDQIEYVNLGLDANVPLKVGKGKKDDSGKSRAIAAGAQAQPL